MVSTAATNGVLGLARRATPALAPASLTPEIGIIELNPPADKAHIVDGAQYLERPDTSREEGMVVGSAYGIVGG